MTPEQRRANDAYMGYEWDDPDTNRPPVNDPWTTIDKCFGIVRNILATLGFFCTLAVLGYFWGIWK